MKPSPVNEFAATGTDEGMRAQHWRQVIMGLSIKELSELTGYSVTAIRCFEANANTAGELFSEAAWQRYRMACHGVVWKTVLEPTIKFDWNLSAREAESFMEG